MGVSAAGLGADAIHSLIDVCWRAGVLACRGVGGGVVVFLFFAGVLCVIL